MNKYKQIARDEAAKYYNHPGLVGILWVGSSSFGVEDDMVDIDLQLLVKNRDKSQPMQQYTNSNIKIEVSEMSWEWLLENLSLDSQQAWIIEKSIILHDPDNKVTVELEKAKKIISIMDNKKLLWENYSQLYLHYDLEKSLKRNQIITAHIILSSILDALSKFIFFSQNKILPPQKWRWYLIKKDNLFNTEKINELVKLDLPSSREDIVLRIKEIQKECQKIMLDVGFEKEKLMEPWRF